MPKFTNFLNLFKWDTTNESDLSQEFDIEKSMSENWDKLDENAKNVGEKIEDLIEKNNLLRNQIPSGMVEGDNIAITDSSNLNIDEIVIKGKTKQASYKGYNKLYLSNNTMTSNGVTTTISNDNIDISGTITSSWFNLNATTAISLNSNTTYTFWRSNTLGKLVIRLYFSNNQYQEVTINEGANKTTFTTTNAVVGYYLWSYGYTSGDTVSINNLKVMLYEGTTTKDWEPYVGGIASPSDRYPQDIQVVTGEYEIEETGTSESKTYTLNLGSLEMVEINTHVDQFVKNNDTWVIPNKVIKINSYNGESITTDYISTTGGLDTGATVYYVGSDTFEITDTNLIKQLDNLIGMETFKNTTQIIISGENLTPTIKLTYKKDLGTMFENINNSILSIGGNM